MIRAAIAFIAGTLAGYAFAMFYELVRELSLPERLPNFPEGYEW